MRDVGKSGLEIQLISVSLVGVHNRMISCYGNNRIFFKKNCLIPSLTSILHMLVSTGCIATPCAASSETRIVRLTTLLYSLP
jgi:hypothetical protein